MTQWNRRALLRNSALAVGAAVIGGPGLVENATKLQAPSRPAATSQGATYLWPALKVPTVT